MRHAIYEYLRTTCFVHIGHSAFTVAIPSYCTKECFLTGVSHDGSDSTSDDTHLADDSKQQENAASHSGYAPPVEEERRIAGDGEAYTFHEFLAYYGEKRGNSEWRATQNLSLIHI